MLNRRTIANVYDSLMGCDDYDDAYSEDTLQHHGVLGMSWGDRHGPPYPLEGADKKAARADAKKKREQERRLRKLQKAAKKARKLKKKQAREQEQIEKKKAKLIKKGDLNAIRKNQKLFTNEELMAAVERKQLIDASKQPTKKEKTQDEKMEIAMKRMAQIADIASKTAVVLGAVKTGAEAVSAYKASKVKDLEAEEKRNTNLSKQFDMIFKADPEAGKQFLKLNVPGYDGLVTSAKNEKANQKQSSNGGNRLRLALANRTAYRSANAPAASPTPTATPTPAPSTPSPTESTSRRTFTLANRNAWRSPSRNTPSAQTEYAPTLSALGSLSMPSINTGNVLRNAGSTPLSAIGSVSMPSISSPSSPVMSTPLSDLGTRTADTRALLRQYGII